MNRCHHQPTRGAQPGTPAPGLGRCLRVAAWLVLGLAPVSSLWAQTLYEWREPDGVQVVSQFPPAPGAGTELRALKVPDLAGPARATALRVGVQGLPEGQASQQALAAADARIARALTALQQAEALLRNEGTPLAGERRHLANGHSRLTRAYFDRISALESAVASARAELQAAYAQRDGLGS